MIQYFKITYSKPVAIVYLIASVLAAIWQHFHPAQLIDTAEYLNTALNWLTKSQISDTPLSEIRRSPLYPALAYLQYPLTHSPGIHSLRFAQWIASICIPVVVHQILILLNSQKRINLVLLLLMSYPLQFYYSALELPDIITQLFILILFRQLLLKKNTGITVAILLGLKPIFFYLLALPIVQIILRHEKNWIKALIPFLFFGGCLYFNNLKHNLPSYTSMGTTNSYYYNRKMLLLRVKSNKEVDSIYSQESEFIHENKSVNRVVDSFMRVKTKESILKYPFEYLFIHLKGSAQVLIDPGRYDAMVFLHWPKSSGFLGVNDGNPQKQQRPLYEWIYMIVFALLGLLKTVLLLITLLYLLKKGNLKQAYVFIFILFVCYLLLLGPVGAARYLLPWYSVIAIIIGINLLDVLRKSKYENTLTQ